MPNRKKREQLIIEAIPGFELELENTLKPVEPDPTFIDRLHKRLLTTPEVYYYQGGITRNRITLVMVVVMLIALLISVTVAIGRLLYRPCRGD